jgi:Flp pilus assembly protein TadB
MSKERARRRAAREHEAALRTAARAAEAERRERRLARRKAVRAATTGRVRPAPVGRATGALAHRSRVTTSLLVAALLFAVLVVWVVRPDWPARLGAVVVAVLAFPALRSLVSARR